MRSMTGFGRGEAAMGGVTVVVELRSVNNRFRDVQLRLPREYSVFEPRVQAALREVVARGRVDGTIRRTSAEGATRVVADMALADQYRRAITDVARRLQRDPGEVPLATLLAFPGVLLPTEADPDVLGEWEVLEVAIQSATAELTRMREAEGVALAADLRLNADGLEALRGEVATQSEGVAERLRARLEERLRRLVADRVDPARLAQEVALLAEKADISEELARLGSHLAQLREALASPEPVGRKLDFLLQEMNRETNTIGSKAAEHAVSARVVEMKTLLERLREQAQNVE